MIQGKREMDSLYEQLVRVCFYIPATQSSIAQGFRFPVSFVASSLILMNLSGVDFLIRSQHATDFLSLLHYG